MILMETDIFHNMMFLEFIGHCVNQKETLIMKMI
jgi:hypothetical protein